MATPKILFLDQTGQIGGAELCLADVAERRRDSCHVALFQDGPFRALLENRGVPVSIHQMPERVSTVSKRGGLRTAALAGPHLAGLSCRIAKLVRRFDLIYANTPKALVVGSLAAIALRKPILYHLHDHLSPSHFSKWSLRVLMFFARRSVAVIANSEASRGAYLGLGGARESTHLVYNGFDAADFESSSAEPSSDLRASLGIGSAPCLLIVGRLTRWKGQHVLLEALRVLDGVHAVIAGDALFTDGDRRYAEELRGAARRDSLSGRVHFIGFQTNVRQWYQMADAVVHASTAPEPFGRVIVEGMLAGKPVVATKGGGVGEIIVDRLTGHLVAPGDPRALADAVRVILNDPAATAAVAERGRQFARARFSMPATITAWERVVDGVFSGRSRDGNRTVVALRRELH